MSTARSHTQVRTHHLGRLLPLNMSCNINTVCCSVTLIICMLLLVIHMLVVAVVSLLCGFFSVFSLPAKLVLLSSFAFLSPSFVCCDFNISK